MQLNRARLQKQNIDFQKRESSSSSTTGFHFNTRSCRALRWRKVQLYIQCTLALVILNLSFQIYHIFSMIIMSFFLGHFSMEPLTCFPNILVFCFHNFIQMIDQGRGKCVNDHESDELVVWIWRKTQVCELLSSCGWVCILDYSN